MSEGLIGVVNAGSSSLKFSVFAGDECLLNGQVDGIGVRPVANVQTGKGEALPPPDFSAAWKSFFHGAAPSPNSALKPTSL